MLHGAVLLDNARVLRLLRSSGYPLAVARDADTLRCALTLEAA